MKQKLQHTCKDHYIAASMMMFYNLKVIFVSSLTGSSIFKQKLAQKRKNWYNKICYL